MSLEGKGVYAYVPTPSENLRIAVVLAAFFGVIILTFLVVLKVFGGFGK